MNAIEWLQDWYSSQCNGDWEHEYGVKIQTLDNPGWDIRIDLLNTDIELDEVAWTLYENSEGDWWGYKVSMDAYEASGDPSKLNIIIDNFRKLVTNRQ